MTDLPVGPETVPQAMGGYPGTGDEILVAFAGPAQQKRLTVLVRALLAIPHLIVLYVLGIATEVVVVIAWFAALFTGQVPAGLAQFITSYLRWASRVYAYLLLLTDEYPPFEMGDSDYPVHIAVRPGPLNRLAVLFRIILAIPAWLISVLLLYGMGTIVMFITWLIVLIAGTMPGTLYEAIAGAFRYVTRFYGYVFLLTGTYPKGLFGDEPGPGELAASVAGPLAGPGLGQPGYGQPQPGQPGPGQPGPDQAVPRQPGYTQPLPGQPEPGQPEPGQPEPGQPEPGQPGDWQPGPGQPGDWHPGPAQPMPMQPEYGQAGYQQPGYQQPGYGQPGYGQPGYAAALRWPVSDQSWRLVLSSGAKRLIGVFLGLGVVVLAGYIAVIVIASSSTNSTLQGADASIRVQAAYVTLSTAMGSYSTKTAACQGQLSCVTAQDGRAAQAFGTFLQALRSTSVPSGSAAAAQGQLELLATQVQDDLQQLSTASSVSQYQQTLSSTNVQQVLQQFDAQYQKLGKALVGNG